MNWEPVPEVTLRPGDPVVVYLEDDDGSKKRFWFTVEWIEDVPDCPEPGAVPRLHCSRMVVVAQ